MRPHEKREQKSADAIRYNEQQAQKNHLSVAFCIMQTFICTTEFGAGNETRTRDPDLGKVVLYQLSYSRRGVT